MACVSTRRSLRIRCVITPLLDVRRSTRVPSGIVIRLQTSSSPVPLYTEAVGRNLVMPRFTPLSHLEIGADHGDAPVCTTPDDIPIAMQLLQRPCGIWLSASAATVAIDPSRRIASPLHHPDTLAVADSRCSGRPGTVTCDSSSSPLSIKTPEESLLRDGSCTAALSTKNYSPTFSFCSS